MKVSKYLMSNVVRLVKDEYPDSQRKFYIGDIANALRDRYRFLQVPTKIEEFNLQQGVEFIHGVFKEDQIIGKFKVYNNGVYCEAELPTEVISEFIEDVFDWARQEIGMTIEDTDAPNQFFISNLEVESKASLAPAFSKLSTICERLTSLLVSYGQEVPPFETTHLAFHCDISKVESVKPTMFSFEHRVETPFDSGLFFAAAPLKTADHLILLDELESILAS